MAKASISRSKAMKILEVLIMEHFIDLESTHIKVGFVSNMDYYMAVRRRSFFYCLFIDEESLKLSVKAFKGCAAHELAHIVELNKVGNRERDKEKARQARIVTAEERTADVEVILRGLGRALLQFHNELEKNEEPYTSDDGLTKFEIEMLLKIRRNSVTFPQKTILK